MGTPQVALKLPRAPPCFTDVLTLKGASVGWGEPGAQPPLLTGVDLVVKKGQRVLVLGPNGAGKVCDCAWGESVMHGPLA